MTDKIVYEGRFIRTIERQFTTRSGKQEIWEMFERKNEGSIVAVLPVTEKEEVVFVKIFRVPVGAYVYECCAGLIDPGEEAITAAGRELLEETGYQAKELIHCTSGPFDTGITKDEIVLFLGKNATKVQEPQLEDAEDIETQLVPLKDFEAFLLNPPENIAVDLKLFATLPFLRKHYPHSFLFRNSQ